MPDEKFKLPLSSYDELVKIIKAYGHVSEPSGLGEIKKLVGLNISVISRNAGFLTATGILEAGARKMPTVVGQGLAHALEHEMPDEIRKHWRRVVEESEFLSKLLAAIRIRNGMDEQTFEAHIAYSAGQPKKPQFMTGARTVIDILRAAGLITEADGKLTVDGRESELEMRDRQETERRIPLMPGKDTTLPVQAGSLISTSPNIQIQIQININCSAEAVESLGPKLKLMIATLTQGEIQNTNDKPGDV